MFDSIAIPRRLEQSIGESKHEQVLDSLLAEVVVDAKHLGLIEIAMDRLVELMGSCRVSPKRFLHHEPRPSWTVVESHFTQTLEGRSEGTRGKRQVEHSVARKPVVLFDCLDPIGECLESFLHALVVKALVAPRLDLARIVAGRNDGIASHASILVVGDPSIGDPQQIDLSQLIGVFHELEERRNQLAPSQITRASEDREQVVVCHATSPESSEASSILTRMSRRSRSARAWASPSACASMMSPNE